MAQSRRFGGRAVPYGRFPPFLDGQAGREVPETGHPTRHLEADMTACDPKRNPVSGAKSQTFTTRRHLRGRPETPLVGIM